MYSHIHNALTVSLHLVVLLYCSLFLFSLLCFLLIPCCPFLDQGCLWLDQSLQVHIQDRLATEKVTGLLCFLTPFLNFSFFSAYLLIW